jgi:hypothetical protein
MDPEKKRDPDAADDYGQSIDQSETEATIGR